MPESIAKLMTQLQDDPFRTKTEFSSEVKSVLDKVLLPLTFDEIIIAELNTWIEKYQPCLFGKIAAKRNAITYCLIRENTLDRSDAEIKEEIETARLRWTKAGFEGKSSNFIIVLLSRRLALATPNEIVKKIALRVCSLYLRQDIKPDRIYLDHIYLERPLPKQAAWEWCAGVNYFAANGDGRWWQDHRFPAGIAFSINSVGHMVKSGVLSQALRGFDEAMGTADEQFREPKVDSLPKALRLAMGTIHNSSDANSGKATFLRPLPRTSRNRPTCPVELPPFLADKDYCSYSGFYHTDYTVPSEYFLPDVLRPPEYKPRALDFTYLFDSRLDNPDFELTGRGRRIRAAELMRSSQNERILKRLYGIETEVDIADIPRLVKALNLPKFS
jgi:hypothetical protein